MLYTFRVNIMGAKCGNMKLVHLFRTKGPQDMVMSMKRRFVGCYRHKNLLGYSHSKEVDGVLDTCFDSDDTDELDTDELLKQEYTKFRKSNACHLAE
jgi:hypothetical protein